MKRSYMVSYFKEISAELPGLRNYCGKAVKLMLLFSIAALKSDKTAK